MMSLKTSKRKIVCVILILVAVLATVGIFVLNSSKNNVPERIITSHDPEIQRSMTYGQVQPGEDAVVGTEFVKFDAFFARDLTGNGYANKLRGSCREINDNDTLFISLNVLTEGQFENGQITINGQNIKLQTALITDDIIANNVISSDAKLINLNTIYPGSQKLISGVIKPNIKNNINNYSQTNTVTLTGTYVTNGGTRIPIEKQVPFTVDWHGDLTAYVRASINSIDTITKDIAEIKELDEGIELDFQIQVMEISKNLSKERLLIKKQHIEVKIPSLNGYKPTLVALANTGLTYDYNPLTGMLIIEKEAVTDGLGNITGSVPDNTTLNIKLMYPLEAYDIELAEDIILELPVSAYYEGYNNPNSEFQNPKKSNIAKRNIYAKYIYRQGKAFGIEITVGKYVNKANPFYQGYVVSKEKPLNGYNNIDLGTEPDLYTVRWMIGIGEWDIESIVTEENPDTNRRYVCKRKCNKSRCIRIHKKHRNIFCKCRECIGNRWIYRSV